MIKLLPLCITCTATLLFTACEHKHSYTETVTPATCTKQGFTTYTCECGESYIDAYTQALNHDYVNGVCSRCSKSDLSDGLVYKISNDGTYYSVTDIGTCSDENVKIASVYNELPVKAIARNVFKNITFIESVKIPDSVTSIGSHVF